MKILQVVFFYDPAVQYGGPTVNVRNLSRHFIERGHEVTVYCTNYLDYKRKMTNKTFEKTNNGIRVVYFNAKRLMPVKNGRHGLVVCPDLFYKFNSDIQSFDVIHINAYRNFLAMAIAKKAEKLKVPYILQARGSLEVLTGNISLKNTFDFICGRKILRRADKVIALTAYEKELYLNMGVNAGNIEIIPNGLDSKGIHLKIKPGQFRKKLGMPDNKKLILFLGRIHKTKGVDLLIKAFSRAALKNTCLVIVGPDEGEMQSAKNLALDLGLSENNVIFTGSIYGDEKFTAYYDADVFVRSSFMEGLPMSVIESLICGTPVVITKQCCLTEIVDRKVGLVVDYDVKMLSEALIRIVDDNSLRNHFADNTQALYNDFDINNVVDKFESVYRDTSNRNSNSR